MLGIYCRISRQKDEGRDRSIHDQEQLGIELANKLGIEYLVYKDEGVSGTLPINERPSFSALIDGIQNGVITKVYVYDQSRLERSPEVRFAVNRIFKKYNIDVYTSNGLIGKDEQDEFIGTVISAANSMYVALTKKKIKSVLKRNAQEGRRFSFLPYGYAADENKKLIVDPEESSIVKRIFEMSLSGIGTDKIAEIFNKENIPTRYNKIGTGTIATKDRHTKKLKVSKKTDIRWAGNTIRGIITNPHYKGLRRWNDEFYPCPAIVTPEYWQQVNDNFKNNANTKGRKQEYEYLLKGVIRCGRCGRNYYGRTRENKRDHYYMCSSKRKGQENCGNRSINIDVLDHIIWLFMYDDTMLRNLVNNYFEEKSKDGTIDKLKVELKALEKKGKDIERQMGELIKLEISGKYTEDELLPMRKELRTEQANILREAHQLQSQVSTFSRLEERKKEAISPFSGIKSASFNDRKALIQKYIKDIKITYNDVVSEYSVEVFINLPDAKSVVFSVDRNYTKAVYHTDIRTWYPEGEGMWMDEQKHTTYDLKRIMK